MQQLLRWLLAGLDRASSSTVTSAFFLKSPRELGNEMKVGFAKQSWPLPEDQCKALFASSDCQSGEKAHRIEQWLPQVERRHRDWTVVATSREKAQGIEQWFQSCKAWPRCLSETNEWLHDGPYRCGQAGTAGHPTAVVRSSANRQSTKTNET